MVQQYGSVENAGLLHMPHTWVFATATQLSRRVLYPFQLLQENTQMALEMCWENSSERKELHLCIRASQL